MSTLKVGHAFQSEISALQRSDGISPPHGIEVDKLKADQLLTAIAILETQMNDVNQLVEKEMQLLEQYRSSGDSSILS